MRHLIKRYLLPSMMATTCSWAVCVSAQTPDAAVGGDVLIQRLEGDLDAKERRVPLPKFWIGIQGDHVDETLRSQLGIDHGILVRGVMPDSPAAKAGVKTHDILLSVNDKVLHEVPDLFEPVGASEGKPIKLTLLRAGKKEAIEVQPEKRPEDRVPDIAQQETVVYEPHGPFDRFPQPLRMLFMNAPVAVDSAPLPDDVTISITKQGKQPPKISVKRAGESWDVTPETMDKLPPDLRPLVASMLNGGGSIRVHAPNPWVYAPAPGHPGPNANGDYVVPAPYVQPFPGPHAPQPPVQDGLKQEVETLSKEVEALRQAVEALKGAQAKP